MKTLYGFFFCLSACSSFAQDYHAFIQRGVYRDEFWADELPLCSYDYGTRYWFRGDTVIGGQVYQKLLSRAIQGDPNAPQFCPPYTVDTTTGVIYALMREAVATRQVFQFDPTTNTEFLLFDFSVNVGDSVTVGNSSQTVFIESESYENTTVGASRRRLVVITPDGPTVWLESVGDLNSLWNPLAPLCICPHSICYQQVGQSSGTGCATVVGTKEAKEWAGLFLSPNPASRVITITQKQPFNRISVLDMNGRIIVEQYYPNNILSAEMGVNNWPVGNYVATIWQNGKCMGRQMFQKN